MANDGLYAAGVDVYYGRGGSRGGVAYYGWWAELEWRQLYLEYEDKGCACGGHITTRYASESLTDAINHLMAMVERFAIKPIPAPAGYRATYILSYKGGDENTDYPPPPGWAEMLREEAKMRGWTTYATRGDGNG